MDEFMEAAIAQAKQGRLEGRIPIGFLIKDGSIIGKGYNKRLQEEDLPVTHAEM